MIYAIVPSESEHGLPYKFYKFKSHAAAHKASVVDEHSVVYEEPKQLLDMPVPELTGIFRSVHPSDKTTVGKEQIVAALHRMVEEKAVTFTEQKQELPVIKAPAPIKISPASKRIPLLAKIKAVKPVSCRPNTDRYYKQLVVLGSATVAEALTKLKACKPIAGGMVDIRIALDNGTIELE